MTDVAEAVKSIGNVFGALFRHLLPGVLIIATFAVAHPSWLEKVDIAKTEWLIVLGVLATVIGNAWYVVHRYGIQQLVDLGFWCFNAKGGPL